MFRPFPDSPVEAFWGPHAARAAVARESHWLMVVFCGEEFARYRPQDDAEAQEYARGFNAALEACGPPGSPTSSPTAPKSTSGNAA